MIYKLFIQKKVKSSSKIRLLTLKQEEAESRKKLISNVNYNLFLQLNPAIDRKQKVEGGVVIDFTLSAVEDNIFLDFAGYVNSIEINGRRVGVAKDGERLFLKKNYLIEGQNSVNISFESTYSSEHNKGLIWHQDPIDSKDYVYTDTEPCYSHLIYPCFNQPSIKATFELTISGMEGWTAISSGKLATIASNKNEINDAIKDLKKKNVLPPINKGYWIHKFEKTPQTPVSLFGFGVGHFEKVAVTENTNVYLRSSIKNKNADYSYISSTVNKAFAYLKTNLSSQLTNTKLDVVFLPELQTQSSACLNCLMLDESLLGPNSELLVNDDKSKNTYDKILLVAHLIATLSQRWFGIEVTPEWWDDLWISKSFGVFFGFHILKQLSEENPEVYSDLNESWLIFSSKKITAINEDKYSKTHPVKDQVLSMYQSIDMHDAVTFFKGANIIRNLYCIAGPELFFKALRNLLQKYSGNTINYSEFKEIYASLSAEREIKDNPITIIEPFILKNGVNELSLLIETNESNEITACKVTQACTNYNSNYYEYRTKLLLIGGENSLEEIDVIIPPAQNSNIKEVVGKKKPDLILLNKNDICYFRQIFRNEEIEYLNKNGYELIKSPNDRLVVARELYEMVRGEQLKASVFLNLIFEMLEKERDVLVLEFLLQSAISCINSFVLFSNQKRYKSKLLLILQDNFYTKFVLLKNTTVNVMLSLIEYDNETDMDTLLNFLQETDLSDKMSLLRGTSEIGESKKTYDKFCLYNLAKETRLNLVQSIYEAKYFDLETKQALLTQILGDSIENRYFKYTLDAAIPEKGKKDAVWKHLINENEKYPKINAAYMKGFARVSQYSLLKSYLKERFFNDFATVRKNHSIEYSIQFFRALNPSFIIEDEILTKLNNLKAELDSSSDYKLTKEVDKVIFELFLKLKITSNDN